MGGNMLNAMKYISTVPFSGLFNWSVQYLNDSKIAFSKAYPMMRIGEFLKRNKTAVTVQDGVKYKRVTIKVRNGGVVLRDEAMGENIGTKKQFLVSKGQFILSKIDARNGAMGIIPAELDGAIVTQDFLPYDIDTTQVNPQYFVLVCTTKQFIAFCQSCSSGTTNRQRVDEPQFLNIKVPVPSLEEQNELVEEYNKAITKIVDTENTINTLKKSIDRYICDVLGYNAIKTNTNKIKRLLSTYHYKDLGRWDIFNLNYEVQSEVYPTTILKDIVVAKPKYGASYKTIHKVSDVRYIRITDINEDGTLNEDIVSADGYDNQYLLQDGDFLIARSGNTVGKTFLYQSDIGKAIYAGYLIKFVLTPDLINPKYLLFYTKSSIYKRWINSNMRVSAQPNINSEQYLFSPIIVPEMEVQDRIVKHIESIMKRIHELAKSSKNDERTALRNFETQIFE